MSGNDSRSDVELVAAANGGEAGAFGALYERYKGPVVHVAARFTRDHDLALEVMQEVFLYWLKRFPGFELRGAVMTFLYPAIRHTAIAIMQKRRRMGLVGDVGAGSGDEDGGDAAASAPQGGEPGDDRVGAIGAALDRLPAHQAEVVLLRFGFGLSLQEVVKAVGVPLGTVKSRLHLAIKALEGDSGLKELFERE